MRFIRWIKYSLLEYNLGREFQSLMDSVDNGEKQVWSDARREQFWRMVSYNDRGYW